MTQVPSDSDTSLRTRAHAAGVSLSPLILSAERLAAMVAPGTHGLRRGGPGEDFWQYRPASHTDAARSIDWRRSARSDERFVRDREAQTAQAMALWISAGQGMGYTGGRDRPTKRDRAQLLGLALSMLLLRGGERVGLLGQPPRSGRIQADRLAERIALAPLHEGEDDSPAPGHIRPGQRLVFISDFLGDPTWVETMLKRAAALGTRGVLLQVLDPDEESFPFSGAVLFRSMTGAIRHDSRDANGLRKAYLDRLAERRALLQRIADGAGWHFGQHTTSDPPAGGLGFLYQVLAG